MSASPKLKFITKLAFGAGDLGPSMTANVTIFFAMFFFTQVAGIPPGLAGSILMGGRIFDAISDPIIGRLSDRFDTPWGRRLPWMFFTAIPFGITFALIWIVPEFHPDPDTNTWLLFGYYLIIGILFQLAITAITLPYTALTPELTQDYNERTSLNSFRFAFSIGGSILSLLIARLVFDSFSQGEKGYFILGIFIAVLSVIPVFWSSLNLQEQNRKPLLSDHNKKRLAWAITITTIICFGYGIIQIIQNQNLVWPLGSWLVAMLLGIFALSLFIHSYDPPIPAVNRVLSKQEPTIDSQLPRTSTDIPFFEQLKIVFSNRPFLYIIGIYLFSWIGVQLTASILPYFVVSWMGLTETDFIQMAIAVQGTALVMLFVWLKVSQRLEKKVVYLLGMGFWIIAQLGLFFLQPGQITLMYILAITAGFGVSVAYLIPWSMLPDVIEVDELKTGKRREGVFYAFMVLLQKLGLALGLFLVGQALELAGFIEATPGEPPPEQPESALLAIRIAIGPIPMLHLIAGAILAWFYPLTREKHQQICLQLAERNNSSSQQDS